MDTRKSASGAHVMTAIEAMMEQAGVLAAGMVLTDCVILTRVESLGDDSSSSQRDRWHPMGRMDDLRERGLLEQHCDDVRDEDRTRR